MPLSLLPNSFNPDPKTFQSSKWIANQFKTANRHPEINFTNILSAAFTHADPKTAKDNDDQTCLFALLGSAHVKA